MIPYKRVWWSRTFPQNINVSEIWAKNFFLKFISKHRPFPRNVDICFFKVIPKIFVIFLELFIFAEIWTKNCYYFHYYYYKKKSFSSKYWYCCRYEQKLFFQYDSKRTYFPRQIDIKETWIKNNFFIVIQKCPFRRNTDNFLGEKSSFFSKSLQSDLINDNFPRNDDIVGDVEKNCCRSGNIAIYGEMGKLFH